MDDFQEFGKLMEIADRTDTRNSLAPLLVKFCEVHGILQPFLRHLLKMELNKTGLIQESFHLMWSVHPATLFREDSFLVSVLNVIMTGDLGSRYLEMLAKPLVTDIVTKSEKGLGVKDGTDEQKQKNSKRLVKTLTSFVNRFASSPFSCPL